MVRPFQPSTPEAAPAADGGAAPGGAGDEAALLRLIIDQSTDYIAVYDGEARLRFASRSVTPLFGYDPEALRGSHALDFVHPEDAPAVTAALDGIHAGRSQLVEFRLRRADGELRWVEASGRPFHEQGRMDGFLVMIRDVHERRRAEAARAAGHDQSEGYLELGSEGRVTAVTRRFMELYGFTPEEMAGVEAAAPGTRGAALVAVTSSKVTDRALFLEGVAGQRRLGEAATVDEVALADGRTLERYGAPRRAADGAVLGRAIFLRDVTERRRTELELRERARQQETVAELGELAMNAQDPMPLLTLATRLVASTLGVDLAQLLELSPDGEQITVQASSQETGERPVGRVLPVRSGSMSGFALRNHAPVVSTDLAGERRFDAPSLRALGVVSAATVVVRGRERPYGVLAALSRRPRTFSDDEVHFLETVANVLAAMLARHAAELALVDRERQLRAVFENTLDALATFDDRGRAVEVNAAACQLFARPRAELLGRPAALLFGAGAREKVLAAEAALRRRGRLTGELELAPPGAPPRQVEFSAVASILPGLHLFAMRDVTEQRALQARLALADRMASVGTLAAGVAHELNNPLSYVTANLSWLAEGLAGAGPMAGGAARTDILQALDEARDGAERMRDIIRDLRTFSRADETRSGEVAVAPVLDSCVNMAWNEIRHRARLVRDLAPVLPVHGNEARLGQVFLNLLVNAAQAIPEGAAEANEIRLVTRPWPDGRVAVEVRDTGCGILPEHRARVFDPFFTTKPPGVGTGLGLSICHNLVSALGGTIEVESELGKGSTFRVLLRPWAGEVEAPAPAAPAPALAPARRRGRVLVVDDEALVGAAVRRALVAEHDVTAVQGAREALARLDDGERYDLVVSDLLMPDMTGIDLHRALGERAPRLAERMIFVTGGAFTSASREFVEAHVDSCLEKPFDMEALRDLVRHRLTEDLPA